MNIRFWLWRQARSGNVRTSNAQTICGNTLARHGLTISEARRKSDIELLAMPGFGKTSLKVLREHPETIRFSNTQDALEVNR